LHNNQIKSIKDIWLAGENKIKAILGEKIGKQIYEYCINKKENEEDEKLI
jgi:nucleotidyltransferase/DNA polymerase involved in DNA repair